MALRVLRHFGGSEESKQPGFYPESNVKRSEFESRVRYHARKLVEGDIEGFCNGCARYARLYSHREMNKTVAANCCGDKRASNKRTSNRRQRYKHGNSGVRFTRVPQGGDTCTFCAMLASRGFVYWSKKTAGEFNHYHMHCRCLVLPDDGSGEWSRKEICTAEQNIGYVFNKHGEKLPTRCFKIHYADDGVHAVPRYDYGGEPDDIP